MNAKVHTHIRITNWFKIGVRAIDDGNSEQHLLRKSIENTEKKQNGP